MDRHLPENTLEIARLDLRMLVLEFRSIPLSLVDQLEPELCQIILSQFAVWLLDQSIDTVGSDTNRRLHAKLRELHAQRSEGGFVDPEQWTLLHAESLAASKLWPPEWLCAPCLPSASPIARAAATIAMAKCRLKREGVETIPFREYREFQAQALRSILSQRQ